MYWYTQKQTKSAKACLHLLPPISDNVIVQLGGKSDSIFYTSLSEREYLKMKLAELSRDLKWVATRLSKPQSILSIHVLLVLKID